MAHFLSRLCGGEYMDNTGKHRLTFLSRLCGGESCDSGLLVTFVVSKPPVWR